MKSEKLRIWLVALVASLSMFYCNSQSTLEKNTGDDQGKADSSNSSTKNSVMTCSKDKGIDYQLSRTIDLAVDGSAFWPIFQIVKDSESLTDYREDMIGYMSVATDYDEDLGKLYSYINVLRFCGNLSQQEFNYFEEDNLSYPGNWITDTEKKIVMNQDEGQLVMKVKNATHPGYDASNDYTQLVKVDYQAYDITLGDGSMDERDYDTMRIATGEFYVFIPKVQLHLVMNP